ncbi:MAG: hypothetical protein KGI79_00610 [Patescibacteria group bacterium]|nr:hypothetical protein [Patescibacteria group bacterium]MDE2116363.1 hypothetical protein [Patescibacteria group bacterium]
MDPQFHASFIPKKPITTSANRSPATINLFSLLAAVIFIVALALAGGVFFYNNLVQKQIASDQDSFQRAQAAFEPSTVDQIVRLDTRLNIAKKLLASHIAVTPFFSFLSTVTLQTVRFKDFSFSYLTPSQIVVDMHGQATSYQAVALESDLLSSQKQLHNVVVSDLALDQTGAVTFSVAMNVDPSLISYGANIPASAVPSTSTASTSASTQ